MNTYVYEWKKIWKFSFISYASIIFNKMKYILNTNSGQLCKK